MNVFYICLWITGVYSQSVTSSVSFWVDNSTLNLLCACNWSLTLGSRLDASLTLDGDLHSVYQTKNSSGVDELLQFVFTTDDVSGQLGKRVSTYNVTVFRSESFGSRRIKQAM